MGFRSDIEGALNDLIPNENGMGTQFDHAALADYLKQFSFDDLAKAFFALNMWLRNIASPIKFQYLYRTFESICGELPAASQLNGYVDFETFCNTLFPLLPSFITLEDYVPEPDWGDVYYFFRERRFRVFYGCELSQPYEFYHSFEILHTDLDAAFKKQIGRSPLYELQFCLEFQQEVLERLPAQKITGDSPISPGDLTLPSEEFWTKSTEFIDSFDPVGRYGSKFVSNFGRDATASEAGRIDMNAFTEKAFEGKNSQHLFLRKAGKTYPVMPRRAFPVVLDTWGELLKKHHNEITPLLKDPDLQHHAMIGLSHFIQARWPENDTFIPATAINEDLRPDDLLLLCIRSKDTLFVFHTTPPALTSDSIEKYLIDLVPKVAECKKLLSVSPTRVGLPTKGGHIEFGAAHKQGLHPELIIVIPPCNADFVKFEIPADLDASVMGLDQLCGLIDEVEEPGELSDFSDYIHSLDSVHLAGGSYLDVFGSFRDSHSILVPGATEPDMISLDPHWGASTRYESLRKFWERFPDPGFEGHPRSWSIPEEKYTPHGLVISSKTFRAYAYCERLGSTTVFINTPIHLMTWQQAQIAENLIHSLSDAIRIYSELLGDLAFTKVPNVIRVLFFPASLVRESQELEHLKRFLPTDQLWVTDINKFGRKQEYGIRLVYDDDRVISTLESVADRTYQILLLADILDLVVRIFPGPYDDDIFKKLHAEERKPPRFKLFAMEKRVSFPELISTVTPETKDFKFAAKEIAQVAYKAGIEPGTYTDEAQQKLNVLVSGVVSRLDEKIVQFSLKDALPFLLEKVDALTDEYDRDEKQLKHSLQHEVDFQREDLARECKKHFIENHKSYRYLIEKFVQLQPSGTASLTSALLAELLALVDRLLGLYTESDFLQYDVYPIHMTIDSDFRVQTSCGAQIDQLQNEYGKHLAQLDLGVIGRKADDPAAGASIEDYMKAIDTGFRKDFGFALFDLINVQQVMALWAAYARVPEQTSYGATEEEISTTCSAAIADFDTSTTNKILEFLTLSQEDVLKVKGKNGFDAVSTLPVWEYAKRPWRYTIRPLIKIENVYHWGPHSVERSARHWSGIGQHHRLPADIAGVNISAVLQESHDSSTKQLADKIEEITKRFTTNVKKEVYPHKLDGTTSDIGDVDVLAYLGKQNVLLNIESKIIDPAYCIKDVARIQRKIFGRKKANGSFSDGYLQKVEQRDKYLETSGLDLVTKLRWGNPAEPPRVVSIFVTKTDYWWTKFPSIQTDVEFVAVRLLHDFIAALVQ